MVLATGGVQAATAPGARAADPVQVACGGSIYEALVTAADTHADTVALQPCEYPPFVITQPVGAVPLTVEGNGATIRGNPDNPGPVVFVNSTTTGVTLRDMTITGARNPSSSTHGLGGGLFVWSDIVLDGVTVTDNQAYRGAGMLLASYGITVTIVDSTISDNVAELAGGGIGQISMARVDIINSTVSGNSAENAGGAGGIYVLAFDLEPSTIRNSTIVDNGNLDVHAENAVEVSGSVISNYYSDAGMDGDGYNVLGPGSRVRTDDDPTTQRDANLDDWLGPLQDNGGPTLTHAPLPGTPLVDRIPVGEAGCGSDPATDQRGVLRPQGSGCEPGAVELLGEDTTPPSAAPAQEPPANAAGWNASSPVRVDWNWTDAGGLDASACPATSTATGDGVHELTGTCTDVSGNEAGATHTVRIDTTAPQTTLTDTPPDPSLVPTASLTFVGEDGDGSGVVGFECSLDGGSFAACTSPWTLTDLTPGTHSVAVRAVDLAGNIETSPGTYTWEVQEAAGQVADIRTDLDAMDIHHGITNALDSKLAGVVSALEEGDTAEACDRLHGVLDLVSAQTGKKITLDQAEQLTGRVTWLREALDC